jgi:hypothetical protein
VISDSQVKKFAWSTKIEEIFTSASPISSTRKTNNEEEKMSIEAEEEIIISSSVSSVLGFVFVFLKS